MDQVHQLIYNMIFTKYLNDKKFDYTDSSDENLDSIEQEIRDSYQHIIRSTPEQAVFGRDIIFNLTSVFD